MDCLYEGRRYAIVHVTRRDATSSILVLVMAKIPLPNGLGVLCKVDIVPKAADPACSKS